jgi:transposase
MYRDVAQWTSIRKRILQKNVSIRRVVRETGISRGTIRKMLNYPVPKPFGPRGQRLPKLGPHTASVRLMLNENASLPLPARLSVKAIYRRLRDEEGFRGGYSTVRDFARPIAPDRDCIWEYAYDLLASLSKERAVDFLMLLSRAEPAIISSARVERFFRDADRVIRTTAKPDRREEARQKGFEWMRAVLQKEFNPALRMVDDKVPDLAALLNRLYDGRLSDRNRSMAVLANRHGISSAVARSFLAISKQSYQKYLRHFREGGCADLFARQARSTRKFDSEAVKQAVFGLLHQPPSNFGINRTTWIMADLARVLADMGQPVCPAVVRKITKAAGYRWRKARVVLTSPDPDYSDKLAHIRKILSGLGPDEAFFSIDEFGPFAVKKQPGRALNGPGEQRTVPQRQKSRGCLIMTAALELSGNQVTHFWSPRKNTAEMIRMMEVLLERYRDRSKLYLSWDAASWHVSTRLQQRVDEHNWAVVAGEGLPLIETAPLPSGAQFLNVIESVFSGMARAVIHNSDYLAMDDAKAAIDRHFEERNTHFAQHPRRAGSKIWGKEREVSAFSQANNCKDPRYR